MAECYNHLSKISNSHIQQRPPTLMGFLRRDQFFDALYEREGSSESYKRLETQPGKASDAILPDI